MNDRLYRADVRMQCPYCGSADLKVLDTTDIRNGIRRRRECQQCHERFTTYERPMAATPVLIKSNGNREEFDREKLKRGIWNACGKRPIPAAAIDRLVARIETDLQSMGRPEVSTRVVGDLVTAGLKALDPIAYIRYAIVYMGLDNLLSVRAEIDKLLAEQQVYTASQPSDAAKRVAEPDLPTPAPDEVANGTVEAAEPSGANIPTPMPD